MPLAQLWWRLAGIRWGHEAAPPSAGGVGSPIVIYAARVTAETLNCCFRISSESVTSLVVCFAPLLLVPHALEQQKQRADHELQAESGEDWSNGIVCCKHKTLACYGDVILSFGRQRTVTQLQVHRSPSLEPFA